MRKNLYHLELAVKDVDFYGIPAKNTENSGWMHLFGTFNEAAQFVFDIVHDRSEEGFKQREITLLKLTRYTLGGLDPKFKKKRSVLGFHQWHLVVSFEGQTLEDINKYDINLKNRKQFVNQLADFWRNGFKDIDNNWKQHLENIRSGKY